MEWIADVRKKKLMLFHYHMKYGFNGSIGWFAAWLLFMLFTNIAWDAFYRNIDMIMDMPNPYDHLYESLAWFLHQSIHSFYEPYSLAPKTLATIASVACFLSLLLKKLTGD